MSAAGSDSDAETVITEGTIEGGKGSKEKEAMGKVSQITIEIYEVIHGRGGMIQLIQFTYTGPNGNHWHGGESRFPLSCVITDGVVDTPQSFPKKKK